ncbi:MAG: glycosyltransferase family 4 protein [Acidimicrobiales bacterium]
MVSTDLRRDLARPMRHFTRFEVVHLYRRTPYGDLAPEELSERDVRYRSPVDLLVRLREARPDVVQGVEPLSVALSPYQAVVDAYARARRIPVVASAHASRPLHHRYGRVGGRLARAFLRPLLQRPRVFFCVNQGAARELRAAGVPDDRIVSQLYGTWGVDVEAFSPVPDGREPRWSRPTALFVGRVHAEKGIWELLRAFRLVIRRVPEARLVLAGDGPDRKRAAREAATLGDAVRFLGPVLNRDLPALLRAAALVAAPSVTTRRWEEYAGAVPMQAMACGTPVVATRSGALPQYVPDGAAGVLVAERDPGALAAAMTELLTDPDRRRRLGAGGREHAVSRLDDRRNVQAAEDVIAARCL